MLKQILNRLSPYKYQAGLNQKRHGDIGFAEYTSQSDHIRDTNIFSRF